MAIEIVFTEKHATVFTRYIHYNYEKIVDSCKSVEDECFTIKLGKLICEIEPQYDDDDDETLIGIIAEIRAVEAREFGFCIAIWKKFCCETCNITPEMIEKKFNKRIGTLLKYCRCGSSIRNNNFDSCESCYIYGIVREENCCVCLENDFSWVRLNCNCKGGRIIHLHCFHKLVREFDQGWKIKCPCCRKKISICGEMEIEKHPDFIL